MKFRYYIPLMGLASLAPSGAQQITSMFVNSSEKLESILSHPINNTRLILTPGDYQLTADDAIDSSCGNCQNPDTTVNITIGLEIRGRNVLIIGPAGRGAVFHTNAGYGLFFNDCDSCTIIGVTITDGRRDPDGRATDAAIVVKNSSVTISDCNIQDNIGDTSVVNQTIVGIMGIAGRENSNLQIHGNTIQRNSWDGIALYRGAKAVIEDNIIDGVDKAVGKNVGGGRGVAIGVTWNGQAEIRRNLVKRYWKGIGLFLNARGTVMDNIVEDLVTWGIAYWDADVGKPIGFIENNIIYQTGACGASIIRSAPGDTTGCFNKNILVRTGQNPKYDDPDYYCTQCALAVHAVPDNFIIGENLFFDTRQATGELPDFDMPEALFREQIQLRLKNFSNKYLEQSDFYRDFNPQP